MSPNLLFPYPGFLPASLQWPSTVRIQKISMWPLWLELQNIETCAVPLMHWSLILSILIIPAEELNILTSPASNSAAYLFFFLLMPLFRNQTSSRLFHHFFSKSFLWLVYCSSHPFLPVSTCFLTTFADPPLLWTTTALTRAPSLFLLNLYPLFHLCGSFLFTSLFCLSTVGLSRACVPPPLDNFPPPAPCSHWRLQRHLHSP